MVRGLGTRVSSRSGCGYYIIRRETGRMWPDDFEFFSGSGFSKIYPIAQYSTLDDAVEAWSTKDDMFRINYKDAYIVGPYGGYYDLTGKRLK